MSCTYHTQGSKLPFVMNWIGQHKILGFDTETTGLTYQKDRIRLIQLSDGETTHVLDCFALGSKIRFLLPLLQKTTLVGHNLQFDLAMMYSNYGFFAESVYCTQLAALVIAAGLPTKVNLQTVAKRYIDADVDKAQQKSAWGNDRLDTEQIAYAAEDAAILLRLKEALDKSLAYESLTRVAQLENDALLFIAWMAATGVPWDAGLWREQVDSVDAERLALEEQMSDIFPNPQLGLFGGAGWAWSAKIKTDRKKGTEPIEKAVLRRLGFQFRINAKGTESINDDDLAMWDHPMAKPLRKWHTCKHNLSTYGADWFDKAINGRIFPSWWQILETGRTSSSKPSGQTLPKDPRYRKPFRAEPGWKFIHADYSGNEARCAAHIAPEPVLLKAWQDDPRMDMHMLTAVSVFKKPPEKITKEERKKAKSLNFRSQYGGGYGGLPLYMKAKADITITTEEAKELLNAYRKTYPGFAAWHKRCGKDRNSMVRTGYGRLRKLPHPDMMTTKTNTVVQGTCADGIKLACAAIYKERHKLKGAEPCLLVHDELDFHAPEGVAEEARQFIHECMVNSAQPLMPSVPVVVDSAVQNSWYSEE